MKKLTLLKSMLLLCALVAGSGSVWATLPTTPKWVATSLADIADGATIIIISNSTTATNVALPSTATTSNPAKKICEVSTTDGITTITPPDGTTLQDLAWTLTKSGDNYKFYQEGSNSVRLYLTGLSSNTALRVGNASSSNDEFVLGDLGQLLKVTTGTRFVGPYDNSGSDWRTYNTENATNYKGAALTFYVLKYASVTFGATKTMLSFSDASNALDLTTANLPSGLAAYKVSEATNSAVTLTAVNSTVAAGTGVILTGTESTTYNIPVVTTGTDISTSNLLVASNGSDNVTSAYVLSSGKFHPVAAGGIKIPAGKAYLPAGSITSSHALDIEFDNGNVTGIQSVEGQKALLDGAFYNLAGQRVAQPTKGLYIVNGKKVVIK